MKSKQLHTERHPLGQDYHLNKKFLEEFKIIIEKWKSDSCACRLCKKFQSDLEFVN